jgi:hypothetical protein
MFEAIGVGDLHLTDILGKGGLAQYIPDADNFVLNEFQKAVDWARDNHISHVIQYGDVCEGPRMSYTAMLALTAFLQRNDDMQFYFISGNHDTYAEDTANGHSLEILQLMNLRHVHFITKPRTLMFKNVPVRFLPYPSEDFDPHALNIFHKEVRGAKNDAGKAMSDDKLPASDAVTVAGHLHTSQRVRNTFFSGTLYQTNFGEKLPKYFHHIRFRSPKDYEIELVPHKPKYTLHNVVLNSRADVDQIPKSKYALVKLVIADGADVRASDFGNFQNIVQVKTYKSKDDLQKVLFEDLSNAKAIEFDTLDFFEAYLDTLDISDEDRDHLHKLRDMLLKGEQHG